MQVMHTQDWKVMPNYQPSLEERRLRIIENCCGGGEGGGLSDDSSGDDGGGFGAETDTSSPQLRKVLDKLKNRKRKGKE